MASAAWERRNEAARARGYKNYYDYRMHRYGRSPERVSGDEAEQLRGHRGRGNLLAVLRRPDRVALIVETPITDRGTWTHMRYIVTFNDADIRSYVVPIADQDELDDWHDAIYDSEIDFVEYAGSKGAAAAAAA